MKMKKILSCLILSALALTLPVVSSFAADVDLKAGEAAVYEELRAAIPKDKIKTADDLYAKWQEIQSGKSKAVIIDIRTEAEFDAGHILNSSNVDSGHA
ncbi:MAG: hypothetical protein D3908_15610, partial [Candidatus Electrothrix sp. AUS4]|nr:hypothetical protein [Candidatus Electrothrix sp. AUS4]